jgi:hypothetical protein
MSKRRYDHRAIDLTGKVFGAWHVTRRADNRADNGSAFWLCLCLCGNTSEVAGNLLRNGRSLRCRACANRGDTRVR